MKSLIWDFDGTLAYRDGGWSGALMQIVRESHPELEVDRDELTRNLSFGFPWHTPSTPHLHIKKADHWWKNLNPLFEKAFLEIGINPAEAEMFAEKVRGVYTDHDSWKLFKDTLPVLMTLKSQGWSHILLTNHVPELNEIVNYLGLDTVLTCIYNSAETGFEKPHPQAFLNILDALPRSCRVWMIGDNVKADIQGAHDLKIPTILVRRYEPTPGFFCEDLAAIPPLLCRTM